MIIRIIEISSSINSKLNNKHTMLLELDDKTPNITNNDIINSSSNIRKWNILINICLFCQVQLSQKI